MHLVRTDEAEIAQSRLSSVIKCIDTGDHVRLKQIFGYLQPSDTAWIISNLSIQKRLSVVKILGSSINVKTLAYLDKRMRRELINNMRYDRYPEDYTDNPELSHDDFIQHTVFQAIRHVMNGHKASLYRLFDSLKPADSATVLEFLSPQQRLKIVNLLGYNFQPEILTFIDSKIRDEIIEHLPYETLIHFLAELSRDDIISILQDIDVHRKALILHSISKLIDKDDFKLIKKSLSYEKNTAGRIMNPGITCATDNTVRDVYTKFCTNTKLAKSVHIIYIHDPNSDINQFRLVGQIYLSDLCKLMDTKHSRTEPIYKYMQEIPCILYTNTCLSEIGFLFKKYCIAEMPVVNPKNQRMMGVIDCTQALDILDTEIEGEILSLAGLQEFDFHEGVARTIRTRIQHLGIASIATIASVSVIHLFEATLNQNSMLAVLMPIAPAIGGNAASQVLTVTVRALSNREIGKANIWRTIKKEVIANLGGGLLIGLGVGLVSVIYYKRPMISFILFLVLTANICWAGLIGSGVPILLDKYNKDPALASVFLNVATDIFGYALLLGLARIFLGG